MTTFFAADAKRPKPDPAQEVEEIQRTPWLWMVLACVLLAASGLTRLWQDRRFDAERDRVVTPLFPLKDLPSKFGKWRQVEGGETTLDPQISRVAGSVDSVVRNYVDEDTGVVVTVVVLYGRAETVVLHTPEICYPAGGYQPIEDVYDITLQIAGGAAPSRFRSLMYRKEGGTVVDRDEVYYSFYHDGKWSPELSGNWRTLRYSPAVFKIQTRRLTADHERRSWNNPSEQFLLPFVKELNNRIDAVQRGGPKI